MTEELATPSLVDSLETHRAFVRRGYAMFRFLQTELERRGMRAVQWVGLGRDGLGHGIESSREWVQNYLGMCYVSNQEANEKRGPNLVTPVPTDGLNCVFVQLRWLDKSEGNLPVVWVVPARATRTLQQETILEPYYFNALQGLERDRRQPDRIVSLTARAKKYPPLTLEGAVIEIPINQLPDEAALNRLVIEQVLASRAHQGINPVSPSTQAFTSD